MSAPEYILLISDLAGEHRYRTLSSYRTKGLWFLIVSYRITCVMIFFYSVADRGDVYSGSRIQIFPSRIQGPKDPGSASKN